MTPANIIGHADWQKPASDEFERRYGVLGGIERRGGFAIESDIPLNDLEVRDSGAGGGQFTIVGHASVFNQWSLDLGGFRERIRPGFFDDVMRDYPDVWHVWDHDTRWVLSRTRSKTLDLSVTPRGLRMWSRVAPTSYAADLRVLMDRGDIDQASFAFSVAEGGDEWRIVEENGVQIVERDLIKCGGLYDVTTCAMGAYPQTDSKVARQKALDYAVSNGRLPSTAGADNDNAAPAVEDVSVSRGNAGSGVHIARAAAIRLRAANTPRI